MGRVYLRTLDECEKRGVILQVTCPACRRVVYVTPYELIGRKVGRIVISRGAALTDLEAKLRCRGGGTAVGCGYRPAEVRALWPHEIPGLPPGVPIILWLRADTRERRRLELAARKTAS